MQGLIARSSVIEDVTSRHTVVAFPAEESADRACLANFMNGLSDELEADGLLVACHYDASPPVLLFTNGDYHRDAHIKRSLLWSAVRSLEENSATGTVSIASNPVVLFAGG